MQNINSIDARIEECKTIIRDEYVIRTIHIKKDIARLIGPIDWSKKEVEDLFLELIKK